MSQYRIQAGKYRHVIQIQQRQSTQNAYGESTHSWVTIYTTKAFISPTSGNLLYKAEEVNAEDTYKVSFRYLSNVTSDMRILFNNRHFVIVSISNYLERNLELQLTCKELHPNAVPN